jgi:hypothetical protein
MLTLLLMMAALVESGLGKGGDWRCCRLCKIFGGFG